MSVLMIIVLPIMWILVLNYVFPKLEKTSIYSRHSDRMTGFLGYEKVRKDAEAAGVNLNIKEYFIIAVGSVLVGVAIAIWLNNYFFIAVAMILSYMMPRQIVAKLKRNRRQKILFELPDNLKMLTSKLIDFPSVLTALEQSVSDMEGETKLYFEEMLEDLRTGFTVETAISEIKQKINLRRFDDFAEKLLMADEQGFHEQSIKSLKETGRDMTSDNLLLKELQIKCKKDLRNLYIIVLLAWAMPVSLSGMNTNNTNIFLDTIPGQIYIVFFVIVSMFSIVKAEDYLSLNLDEI